MAARAMWKAEIRLGSARVPVKLYAAARDNRVHFRLLHADDMAPVRQRMVDPSTGDVVPPDEIQMGLEIDEGVFVVLDEHERSALEPEPSRAITIEQVIDRDRLDVRLFERPYYLGPDGDEDGYFALVEALGERVAVARWVMRKKRYRGALQAADGYLALSSLRRVEELVAIEAVRPEGERAPDPRELGLAEQLIGALEGPFDATAYRDRYRDRVMELIEAKAEGEVVPMPEPARRRRRAGSLARDLEASLRQAREGAGAR